MTDTPMHTEQPGSRQAEPLWDEMIHEALCAYLGVGKVTGWDRAGPVEFRIKQDILAAIKVLRRRGLISPQGLELLKEQE